MMKVNKTVLILGGDKRQDILSKLLAEEGYKVSYLKENVENISDTVNKRDIIILPLPISKDRVHIYSDNSELSIKLEDILPLIKRSSIVFGGSFSKELKEYFEDENIEYHDLLTSEIFELENGYLTSQGALRLLLDNTEEALNGKAVLITGYGRIAVPLSEKLKRLDMKVTVVARNKIQLKTAELSGLKAMRFEQLNGISEFDFVFNTVPCKVFDEKLIATADKNSIYFELASAPFGADKMHFEKLNLKHIQCASLPGKLLPVSSAKLIKDYIEQFI